MISSGNEPLCQWTATQSQETWTSNKVNLNNFVQRWKFHRIKVKSLGDEGEFPSFMSLLPLPLIFACFNGVSHFFLSF